TPTHSARWSTSGRPACRCWNQFRRLPASSRATGTSRSPAATRCSRQRNASSPTGGWSTGNRHPRVCRGTWPTCQRRHSVYAFLWRLLPGPLWLRIVQGVILVMLALFLLVTFLFPWLNTFLNAYDVTVEE